MLDIFHGLRLVVKRRTISIDNAIFRCHWFFTSTLLVSFSVIITARQYVGQPIECHSMNKIPNSLLNSYCWVQSTFTVPQACNQQIGIEVPYPCIDNTRGREIKIYAYYQWVGMVLFVQGLMFHLPYYLWKVWENGLISAITSGLRVAVLSDQERLKKREIVVEYMHEHMGCHKLYAYKYFLCELICLLNLAGQIWAVDRFFDGQFLSYGLDVLHYSATNQVQANNNQPQNLNYLNRPSSSIQNPSSLSSSISSNQQNNQPFQSTSNRQQAIPSNPAMLISSNDNISSQQHLSYADLKMQNLIKLHRANNRQISPIDPMSLVFPRITKCTYYDFGSSGDVQKHDAICLLPLNIINEKIYIALWFWFFLLAILTLVVVMFRIFAIFSPAVRCRKLQGRCKLADEKCVRLIIEFCDVGDWFLLYMVAENVDPIVMREIAKSLAEKLDPSEEIKKNLCNQLHQGPEMLPGMGLRPPTIISRAESECDFDHHQHQHQNSSGSTIRPEDYSYSQQGSPDQRPLSRLTANNCNNSGYNEHDPRQWRSHTHEPGDNTGINHNHQQQQDQHQANCNNHNHNQLNENLLMEPAEQQQRRAHSSGLGMGLSHRASSRTVAQANECLPLPRAGNRFKKQFYPRRLWSMELGPSDFRRQALFGEQYRTREQPETIFAGSSTNLLDTSPLTGPTTTTATNPDGLHDNSRPRQQQRHSRPTFQLQISAPPDSQMRGLDGPPPISQSRCNSNCNVRDPTQQGAPSVFSSASNHQLRSPLLSPLSRSHSGHSGDTSRDEASRSACDSFVLEMRQAYRRRPRPPMQNYEMQSQSQLFQQRQQHSPDSFNQSISSMLDIMDLERHRRR